MVMSCPETRKSVPELFGSSVFNDDVMQERLPKDVYKSLRKTIDEGKDLDLNVANAVANANEGLGRGKGRHPLHPLVPAFKRDYRRKARQLYLSHQRRPGHHAVFRQRAGKGRAGRLLLPLRRPARHLRGQGLHRLGPTSYAFVKGDSLYIPTAFCSYSGETLDKKTPLLRSMEDLSAQALRILRLFGDQKSKRVVTTVGPEQEYFLVDKELYDQRPDLRFTGRTLFGAKAPKGQELEDHYFGAIKPRVAAFMKDLDEELWKLGILAKTKHNEVAPAQHELAPIFTTTNVATDHNQLTMETMKNVAAKHGLVCLLNEKPFEGVNGSGKHNNWSLSTDTGKNLLDPGKKPQENTQFLLFLAAIIKGVDEYQDLLRISVASAGNDHRLGANEAPPAIVSMFLGDELEGILEAIEKDEPYTGIEAKQLQTGVHVLPDLAMDTTDRNRTSPFAFTGNKFEFRMLGSAISISCPNIMLNTIAAEELRQFADELEGTADLEGDVRKIVRRVMQQHKRIIFNGDGYSEAWTEEAKRRGLLNLPTTVDALPRYLDQKNVELFTSHKIYTEAEMEARYETIIEEYSKTLNIEALTMSEMVRRDILPAVSGYIASLAEAVASKRAAVAGLPCAAETSLIQKLSSLLDSAYEKVEALDTLVADGKAESHNALTVATYYKDVIIPAMNELRAVVDQMEVDTASQFWPYPSYGDLMFRV